MVLTVCSLAVERNSVNGRDMSKRERDRERDRERQRYREREGEGEGEGERGGTLSSEPSAALP
jgi:hypothetical protein